MTPTAGSASHRSPEWMMPETIVIWIVAVLVLVLVVIGLRTCYGWLQAYRLGTRVKQHQRAQLQDVHTLENAVGSLGAAQHDET